MARVEWGAACQGHLEGEAGQGWKAVGTGIPAQGRFSPARLPDGNRATVTWTMAPASTLQLQPHAEGPALSQQLPEQGRESMCQRDKTSARPTQRWGEQGTFLLCAAGLELPEPAGERSSWTPLMAQSFLSVPTFHYMISDIVPFFTI